MWTALVKASLLPKKSISMALIFEYICKGIAPQYVKADEPDEDDKSEEVDEDLWKACKALIPWAMPATNELPALLGFIDDNKVIAVDGSKVKLEPDQKDEDSHMDFVEGANDLARDWVKREYGKNVLIVDGTVATWQVPYNVFHEATERRLMAKGMKYDPAHAATNPLERICRMKPPDGNYPCGRAHPDFRAA